MLEKSERSRAEVTVKQEPKESDDNLEPRKKKCLLESIFEDADDEEEEPTVVMEYKLTPKEIADREIRMYRQMPKLSMDSDPLAFWEKNQLILPTLARMFQKYAVVQATSVASERVFNTVGDIVTIERSCLHPDSVDSLIFKKKNLDGPIQELSTSP